MLKPNNSFVCQLLKIRTIGGKSTISTYYFAFHSNSVSTA